MDDLIEFSLDTESPQKNYNLAKWYDRLGYTAPALTYFLRAAERTENNIFSYECLINGYFCYQKQGSRDSSAKIMLQNAIALLPKRPEAYFFLSQFYERQQNWQEAYLNANMGLIACEFTNDTLDDIHYPGEYGLIFQKAVCGYWWGKGSESRELFQILIDEYWNEMDDNYQKLVEHNITSIGSGPEWVSFCLYKKEDHKNLRFKFNGSEQLERNYSQVFQDIFVLSMLNGKKNGTFLEIGGADPFKGNNTALLEGSFAWSGISIEYDERFIQNYKTQRPETSILHANALEINYSSLFKQSFNTNFIDYLQLDIEPARNTYECMLRLPFDEYKFAVITYEHDYYVDVTRSYREKSREFLKDNGYVLVVNDISPDGKSNFEDWWVHPDLVDPEILSKMVSIKDGIHSVKEYFLIDNIHTKFFDVDNFSSNTN